MCNKNRLDEVLNEGHEFVAWVMQNGHRHTVRASGEDVPVMDSEGNEGNEAYIDYVCKLENTALSEILYADSIEEALAEDIIYPSPDEGLEYFCY